MWDSEREAVISYNGEIYNYPELRDELLAGGFVINRIATQRCFRPRA